MKNAKYLTQESNVISFEDMGRVVIVDAGNPKFAEVKAKAVILAFVAPETVVNLYPDLTPKRFEWLLAFTGLGDVWNALESDLKGKDRAAYAVVKSERKSAYFALANTLALVAQFRPVARKVAPGADLSDDAIKAAWILAERGGE
jgi:hypothetical protein